MAETYNFKRFLALYTQELGAQIASKPGEYRFSQDQVPDVALKMCRALASGGANLSPTICKVCKAFGIRYTFAGIATFLKSDFSIQKDADGTYSLLGPTGTVYMSGESFGVADSVLSSIRSGALGHSEMDEVATRILEVEG